MPKDLDTSWFDLKNYEALKTMSIEGWALAVQTRYFISDAYDSFVKRKTLGKYDDDCYTQEDIEELNNHLKLKPCSLVDSFEYYTSKYFVNDDDVNNSFSISSVNSLTVIESWDIAEDKTFGVDFDPGSIYQKNRDKHRTQSLIMDVMFHKLALIEDAKNKAMAALTAESVLEYGKLINENIEAFEEYGKELNPRYWDENYNDFIREARRTAYDFRHKQYFNRDYISSKAHVTIDLDATDEQIEHDFSQWLTDYRKASGYRVPTKKAHEKLFTQKTFDSWIELGLIPYLDLMLIAKIEGKVITQEKIGELIFPDESDLNVDYRIRTITKPEAERLMESSMWWSLLAQAEAGTRKKQRVDRYGIKQKRN